MAWSEEWLGVAWSGDDRWGGEVESGGGCRRWMVVDVFV